MDVICARPLSYKSSADVGTDFCGICDESPKLCRPSVPSLSPHSVASLHFKGADEEELVLTFSS